MKTVMRPRYYCDHCKKGSGSPSHMKRHEAGCTVNPNRVCGMCHLDVDEGGDTDRLSRDALITVLDAEGFPAMVKAAHGCPACILSVLRTKNRMDDERGPYVEGPEDGRESWSYRIAKESWWADFRSAREGYE